MNSVLFHRLLVGCVIQTMESSNLLKSETNELSNLPSLKDFKDRMFVEPRQLDAMSCGVFVCMVGI